MPAFHKIFTPARIKPILGLEFPNLKKAKWDHWIILFNIICFVPRFESIYDLYLNVIKQFFMNNKTKSAEALSLAICLYNGSQLNDSWLHWLAYPFFIQELKKDYFLSENKQLFKICAEQFISSLIMYQ